MLFEDVRQMTKWVGMMEKDEAAYVLNAILYWISSHPADAETTKVLVKLLARRTGE
jgi:hypothetical protein